MKTKTMNKTKNIGHISKGNGFTLIELVVVIVILGILAATAAPKFIDLTGDANESVLNSLAGTMRSSGQLVYTKSIIQGLHNEATGEVDLDGDGTTDISTKYGYPNAHRSEGIINALDISEDDWTWSGNGSNNVFFITTASLGKTNGQYVNTVNILASNCYVTYTGATSAGESAVVEVINTGC
ncbi:type II secretion system protein [Pseudocolwellia sp. AS88]|jgi:MSHA pilin protein MshA|uniref:type II secretion system protein n=1 Tax=Pseudocolwellia sp. AS88 TaxID=3063958 RepID=UPI0026F11686|nr:type II secretion system protein [Pseudocolwellia sp. AS88]MDO7083360.1 type II secretion system protein [Pseudocolwellia sp. AS88]